MLNEIRQAQKKYIMISQVSFIWMYVEEKTTSSQKKKLVHKTRMGIMKPCLNGEQCEKDKEETGGAKEAKGENGIAIPGRRKCG